MTQINGFKGFVGYSIRELDSCEFSLYCSKNKSLSVSSPPLSQSKVNFTSDFLVRSYSSGCYYYDTDTGKWKSEGRKGKQHTQRVRTALRYQWFKGGGGG